MINRTSSLQTSTSMWKQISKTNTRYTDLLKQISTGKKVTSISDDAVAAKGILTANKELSKIEQYKSNMKMASNELSMVDSTLGNALNQTQRAYDIAMMASNGTYGEAELKGFSTELDMVIGNLKTLANTKYNDTYVFSGTKTTTPAYNLDAKSIKYQGDQGDRSIVIADDTGESINFKGNEVFGWAEIVTDPVTGVETVNGEGVFKALFDMKVAINKTPADLDGVRNSMGGLKDGMSEITDTRTDAGIIENRFTNLVTAMEANKLQVTEMKSSLEDTDLSEVISQWMAAQQSLQASYSVISQSSNNSLLNYI